MKEYINLLIENKEVVIAVIGFILYVVKVVRMDIASDAKVDLIINTLVDNKKLTSYSKFDSKTVTKVLETGKAMGSTYSEIKSVVDEIQDRNEYTSDKGSFKLGSKNGKPIYLRDVTRVSKVLKGLGKLF